MKITQTYSKASSVKSDASSSQFDFSAECSRKPVSLNAMIKDSGAYARVMMALRKVVVGDWRPKQVDHSAYQEWVMKEYLKELPNEMKGVDGEKILLMNERNELNEEKKLTLSKLKTLKTGIRKARRSYYEWLYKNDKDKWYVLDPVISVHEDAVIFEAFSIDESVYGRVSVPSEKLETYGQTEYGTTNIDFSQNLADELYRVRSYRPAWLNVSYEEVKMATSIASAVEKKIDLPETWVNGFLQVQSASSLDGVECSLNTSTMGDVLAILEQRNEKQAPRSLRFIFKKNEPIKISIDPWNIEVVDMNTYTGDYEGEIRIWGRKRLSVIKDLLPLSDKMNIKFLGSGMPSYWSVDVEGHRFDIGLSGWTANDWAGKANFDLLASTGKSNEEELQKAEMVIKEKMHIQPSELAMLLNCEVSNATAALQSLCENGLAMYDHIKGVYRYRQLINQEIKLSNPEEDERNQYAIQLYKEDKVELTAHDGLNYQLTVEAKSAFATSIDLDLDGKVIKASCNCSHYKRNELRKGPCSHLVASVLFIQNQKR